MWRLNIIRSCLLESFIELCFDPCMNLELIMLENSWESFDQFKDKKKCLLIDITKLSQLGTHQGKEIHTRSLEKWKLVSSIDIKSCEVKPYQCSSTDGMYNYKVPFMHRKESTCHKLWISIKILHALKFQQV